MTLHPDIERLKDAIKREVDIVDLAQQLGFRINSVTGDNNHYIVCPMPEHADSTKDGGSCVLHSGWSDKTRDYNTFWCFGCKRHGDVLDFYQRVLNLPKNRRSFFTALRELAVMYQPLVQQVVPEWKEILESRRPDNFLDATVEGTKLSISDDYDMLEVEPRRVVVPIPWMDRVEVFDVRRVHQLPATFRKSLYPLRTEIPDRTLTVIRFRDLDAVGLFIPDTMELVGLLCAPATGRFMHMRGLPIQTKGQSLSGKVAPTEAPHLISQVFAVENPLDYLRLSGLGAPVLWGVWGSSKARGAIRDYFPAWQIPCVVALHLGTIRDSQRRFHSTINPGSGLRWIPRELGVKELPTLLNATDDQVRSVIQRARTASAIPPFEAAF